MITVLVHYTVQVEQHPMLDDVLVPKSKVVKVDDLLELNTLFKNITKVEILKDNTSYCECEIPLIRLGKSEFCGVCKKDIRNKYIIEK